MTSTYSANTCVEPSLAMLFVLISGVIVVVVISQVRARRSPHPPDRRKVDANDTVPTCRPLFGRARETVEPMCNADIFEP